MRPTNSFHRGFRVTRDLPAVLLVLVVSGCDQSPAPPKAPTLDLSLATTKVIEHYDTNNDNVLDQEELEVCPAFSKSKTPFDSDGDGKVSPVELHSRLEQLVSTGTILVDAIAEVTFDNKPLVGATVTLDPEPFMGPNYAPVTSITDDAGLVTFTGHDPKLPGVYLGFYRVRISKVSNGEEQIPERYNLASTLGLELAAGRSPLAQFTLSSRND